jgi:antitoxin ParD1/3/4
MASFAKQRYGGHMSTMNVSLPHELKAFVDDRVNRSGYGSTSEYVRDLIRRDHDRQHLRNLLLDGASSDAGPIAEDAYFSGLRDRIASDA